jgi:hypothetical protein
MATVTLTRLTTRIPTGTCAGFSNTYTSTATPYGGNISSSAVIKPVPTPKGGKGPFRPFTNYTVSGNSVQHTIGVYTRTVNMSASCGTWVDKDIRQGVFTAFSNISAPSSTNLTTSQRNGLLTTAYANMREEMMDVLTNLGELPEVVDMFIALKGTLKKTLKDFLKHIAKHPTKSISEAWLQFRYGWMPLYLSIVDFDKALQKVSLGGNHIVTGRAQLVHKAALPNPTATYYQAGGSPAPGIRTSASYTVIHRATVQAYSSAQDAAFRGNVLEAAWELTTLSFLVDWFVNVGDWLSNLSARAEPSLQACISTRVETQREAVTYLAVGGGYYSVDLPAFCKATNWTYVRQTVPTNWTPTVTIKSPVSAIHLGDIVALARLILGKHHLNGTKLA